jgi:hypothetical protein
MEVTFPGVAPEWFTAFVRNLRFHPARRGDAAYPASTIVLVRLAEDAGRIALAHDDPSVNQLLTSKGSAEPPVVQELWLAPHESDSLRWRYYAIATEWCLETFRWESQNRVLLRRWGQ